MSLDFFIGVVAGAFVMWAVPAVTEHFFGDN